MKEQEDLHQSLQTRLLIHESQQDELVDANWGELEGWYEDNGSDLRADRNLFEEVPYYIENEEFNMEHYDET